MLNTKLSISPHNIINSNLLKDVKCYFFNGKQCPQSFSLKYNTAFHFWKTTMFYALQNESKIAEPEILFSDDFLRNEVVCLFYKENPVGIFMFDWFDLNFPAQQAHSYFKNYPTFIIDYLKKFSHFFVMAMSNLTVDPLWRKSKKGFGISEILLGLATKRFLASKATALIIYTRNDRNTHELTYRHGGIPLLKDHLSHGVASDIIAINRSSVTETTIPGISKWVDHLWNGRINLVP